ncbi:hypothetical protein FIV00_15645 [Labrenzia sp. THAF82]|nr:hypothetical protein FIV00_15645 [Labrenzia sp. THAF82]
MAISAVCQTGSGLFFQEPPIDKTFLSHINDRTIVSGLAARPRTIVFKDSFLRLFPKNCHSET